MLEPRDRRLLLDALRPPEGHVLTDALGVTYTLDLLALLTTPLSFALFDWEDAEGRPVADPPAVLEAIRRHADKMHVFCQAGMIRVPPADQRLLGWLEPCVVEVMPPPEGIFHPKAWILRFESECGGKPVRYRTLVSTRNLTFDRSWDTLLVLEGELRDRTRSVRASAPLAEFLQDLPRRALHQPLAERAAEQVARLAEEVRRVIFTPPPPFEEVRFEPLGIPQAKPRALELGRADRALVVSPFLTPDALLKVFEPASVDTLVSTTESLDAVPPAVIQRFGRVYSLADGAQGETVGEDADRSEPQTLLSGLHAKLYVVDQGWDATVWTGSANATGSLLGKSVELLVGLRGKKSKCGVDAFLAEEGGDRGFLDLLSPFEPRANWTPPEDPQRALEEALDALRTVLAGAGIRLRITKGSAGDAFDVEVLLSAPIELHDGVTLTCRPASLRAETGQPIAQQATIRFDGLSAAALTSFLAFRATISRGGRRAQADFVLNVPAEGMPPDRRDRLLRDVLQDRRSVLRLLLLLLAESGADVQHILDAGRGKAASDGDSLGGLAGENLFEQLVRALHRRPERIREIRDLVAELRRTPEGAALLPEGFSAVFEPVLAAWEEAGA